MASNKKTSKRKTLKDKYANVLPNIDSLKCLSFKFVDYYAQVCFHFDLMSNKDIKYEMYDGNNCTCTIFFKDADSIEKCLELARVSQKVEGYVPNLALPIV